jgi:hypothetical protein
MLGNLFRSWNEQEQRFYYFSNGRYYKDEELKQCVSERICKEFNWLNSDVCTGIKDKNIVNVYVGDLIQYRRPYRSTQTHTGDNIPNGSYTEPMTPEIKIIQEHVIFKDGIFGIKSEHEDIIPFLYFDFKYDLEALKTAVEYYPDDADLFDDPDEGDLQYLLEEYGYENVNDLSEWISGFEVIGNIHQKSNSNEEI